MTSWRRSASKFGAVKAELDGYKFASQGELELYFYLKGLACLGEIVAIKPQDRVSLGAAKYGMIPDFRVELPTQKYEWHEFKGYEQETWPRHKKMWAAYGPGPLHVWKKDRGGLVMTQTIVPKRLLTGVCPECGQEVRAAC